METATNNQVDQTNKRMIRRLLIIFILVLLGFTFFSNTLLNLSLPQVTVEHPAPGILEHEVSGSGTVEAAETSDLYVDTNWAVSDVCVKVGDKVKAGQALVAFRTQDAVETLKDNKARYVQKQLNLQNLEETVKSDVEGGDRKRLDQDRRGIENAKLDMQILRRQINKEKRQLARYSLLTAPVTGVVTEVNAVRGAPVQNGKAAVRIADLSKGQQLKTNIEESKAQYLHVGGTADMTFDALNNAHIQAEITDIRNADTSPSAGGGGSNQEMKEITFTLHDDRLKGGEFGDFDFIKRTSPRQFLLSNDAVRLDENGYYVLVLKPKKGPLGIEYTVQKVSVQVGDADDSKTSILGGVNPIDQVVDSSSKPVSDGDRVLKVG